MRLQPLGHLSDLTREDFSQNTTSGARAHRILDCQLRISRVTPSEISRRSPARIVCRWPLACARPQGRPLPRLLLRRQSGGPFHRRRRPHALRRASRFPLDAAPSLVLAHPTTKGLGPRAGARHGLRESRPALLSVTRRAKPATRPPACTSRPAMTPFGFSIATRPASSKSPSKIPAAPAAHPPLQRARRLRPQPRGPGSHRFAR